MNGKHKKQRVAQIDIIKGIAILAVILYHAGVAEQGYLGVDAFLVINGFLVIPKMLLAIKEERWSSIRFLYHRVMRLLPLLLIAILVCLLVGIIVMLPDDYENLGQSVVASVAFSNNILASITTRDYWNVVNEYKPLMHTWYLGVLFECYLVITILFWIVQCIGNRKNASYKEKEKWVSVSLFVLIIISLAVFAFADVPSGDRFYLLPFRFFEFGIGAGFGIYKDWISRWKGWKCRVLKLVLYVSLIEILFVGQVCNRIFAEQGMLLAVVLLSVCLLFVSMNNNWILFRCLIYLGERSYCLFIWHQVFFAFYRYIISDEWTVIATLALVLLMLASSEVSYRCIEQQFDAVRKYSRYIIGGAGAVMCFSLVVYLRAGVFYDIPELDISADNVQRNMHIDYVERIYGYDVDFPQNEKINILVVGNSYARDWANILMESNMAEYINISYSFDYEDRDKLISRIQQSDYIFTFCSKDEVPAFVWDNVKEPDNVWGLGTKRFGSNNGQIYNRRFQEDYFEQRISIDEEYFILNAAWKDKWGGRYIDMLSYVTDEDGLVRVFTEDKKFISQDCMHLTKSGAQFYADVIDFEKIFGVMEGNVDD